MKILLSWILTEARVVSVMDGEGILNPAIFFMLQPPSLSHSFILINSTKLCFDVLDFQSYSKSHIFRCIVLYVLYWRGGHCCPMHCELFQVYCAPPNLGITRTWICRLNFAQRPIFSGLRIFTSLKSQTRAPSLKSLPEDLCSGFLFPEKIQRPQSGLNPRTLDFEASTLPRDHQGRLCAN